MSNRAITAAKKLFKECGIDDPLRLPLEIIVCSKNIILKEEDIDGADGRILIGKDSAVITINSKIEFKTKRRFVIAHELGHYLLHWRLSKIYSDDEESLNQWYQRNFSSEEVEANEFASEFLMPSELFYEVYTKKKMYINDERKQEIWKSTWFQLNQYEQDKTFYEFCIYAKSYNYTLSVLWED